jgi:hypothetical protein
MSKIIEIETSFFPDYLEETIFMEIPSGMEVSGGKYFVLTKTICGLVHSARQFNVKNVKALLVWINNIKWLSI